MAAALTRADVLRIAELARLTLTPAEVELFSAQLTEILAYAEQVQQIDTTGVAPMSHALLLGTAWRDDAPEPTLDRRDVLANAPDAAPEAGLFRVPRVLADR